LLLNFDQIRNRDRSLNFGKVYPLGGGAIALTIHSLLLRAEKKPDSSIELKTNTASKLRDAGFPQDARTREAREGMKLYPKKIGHADWHLRGRSLQRKRRNHLRRTYPTRWLRI